MMPYIDVFYSRIMHEIFRYAYGTSVIKINKNTIKLYTKISLSCYLIHSIWEQHAAAATYSTSAVDSATMFYFLELQETKQ